ncbi:unnamed protein product [Brassica napus]|uniref:Uncharacterized protein n=2 Tax=Brassica TaxID=3705 RepID=A0A3P6FPH6_BRAOL|nr:unnamed protein product [Brassica napus]VDD49684.1 unnamed protein product [Brassica oleracea]
MGLYSFASLIPSSTFTLYFGNSSSAQYFKNGIEEMAGTTLRCVALAFRTYELEKFCLFIFIFTFILTLVKYIHRICRMVTGDNVQTARAIALEFGILTSDADASEPNLGMGACIRLNMKPHENWKQLVMQDMYMNLFFGDEVFKYFRSYDS